MKIAVLDTNRYDLQVLSDLICDHYFPGEDIFVYKFHDHNEFMEFLFQEINFRAVFVNDKSCNIITIKTIQEMLPDTLIIATTKKNNFIPLNNREILYKPYQSNEVFNCLCHCLNNAMSKPEKIQVHDRGKLIYIPLDEVLYIESYYGKVFIYTYDKSYVGYNKHFYHYENLLHRHHFILIHKSILINIHHIKQASLDSYILTNNNELIASARKKSSAYKKYTTYQNETISNYKKVL